MLLQHGTLLYDLDLRTMFSVLNVSNQKISDKIIRSAEERVTCILKHADVNKIDYKAMVDAFTQDKEYDFDTWSRDETALAKQLAEKKYKSHEWMYLR